MTDQMLPDIAAVVTQEVDVSDVQSTAPTDYGRGLAFSFDAPQGIGFIYQGTQQQLVYTDDQRTLLTWVEKALRTPRGLYPIYGPDYGTDLARYIGLESFDAATAHGEDDIKRCLTVHPLIEDVQDILFVKAGDGDAMIIYLTVIDKLAGSTRLKVTK